MCKITNLDWPLIYFKCNFIHESFWLKFNKLVRSKVYTRLLCWFNNFVNRLSFIILIFFLGGGYCLMYTVYMICLVHDVIACYYISAMLVDSKP